MVFGSNTPFFIRRQLRMQNRCF